MDKSIVISNISILANSAHSIQYLRDFILNQAMSGAFSESKPDAWRSTTLGQEVEIIRGISFPASAKYREPAEQRIVCLRTTNVQDQVDWSDLLYVPESYVKNQDQYIRKNDILISMANSRELVGKVSKVDRDDIRSTLGGFISAIRCREKILPEFLMLVLRTPLTREKIIDSSTQTTNIANISLGRLRPLEIKLPSLDVQREIVERVGQFLNQCDELESTLAKHDQISTVTRNSVVSAISLAQSPKELRVAWERIQNNWEVIAGTTESIESLRELILDILFKPKNSDEWETRSLGDLLTISNGDRSKNYPSKEFRVSAGIPFVNAGHLKDGQIDLSEMDYISRDKYESLRGGKFQDGDILFCLRGSLGKSALVKNFGEGTIASSLAILRVGVEIDAEYLFWFLQSGMARFQIKRFDNGTAQPNLAAKSVLKFEIPLPKLPEQKLIVNKVVELMKICGQLQKELVQKEEVADKFARSVVFDSA